jgi:hypothetical protein
MSTKRSSPRRNRAARVRTALLAQIRQASLYGNHGTGMPICCGILDFIMTTPHFTLTVVTSSDGFIGRSSDETPQVWASPEEQALFLEDVAAADWGHHGTTHP